MRPAFAALAALALAASPQAEPRQELWTEHASRPSPKALPDLLEGTMGAVVAIYATQAGPDFQDSQGGATSQFRNNHPAEGLGTGFVIHPDGYVLTNAHVIASAVEIKVLVGADPRPRIARLVGKDDATDVALLKIDLDRRLPVLPLGDSDQIRVGESVVAIGNPFGLAQSVSTGVVSFKGRRNVSPTEKEGTYFDFIQVDASINPGNSGGPLLNQAGEVVGINAAITQQGQGIGFAVPINMAKKVLPDLKTQGHVERGYVGVVVHDLDAELAASFGLDSQAGAVVAEVSPKSPAEKAGLRPGDVVLEFAGNKVTDAMGLRWMAATARPGTEAELVLHRAGKRQRVRVTLASPPPGVALADEAMPPQRRAEGAGPAGLVLSDGKASEEGGVKVEGVDPLGAAYGAVEEGDLVVEVNGRPVRSAKELENALGHIPHGAMVRLYLRREGEMRFVAFRNQR